MYHRIYVFSFAYYLSPVIYIFSDAHSGINIFDAFQAYVAEYGIDVDYAITDNASSMKKAFNYFEVEPADIRVSMRPSVLQRTLALH